MLGALIGIIVLEMVGAAVLTLLCSDLKRWTLSAKLGLSFGLGLMTLTMSLFIASWGGFKPAWWFGVLEMLVLWGAAFALRKENLRAWIPQSKKNKSPAARDWTNTLRIGLLIFIVAVCVVVGITTMLEPLVEWDVIAIWAMKAQVLFHEPVATTSYFTDISKTYSHTDYPLLWPMAMAWTWTWAGAADWDVVKILGVALFCAYAALFYGLLRRNHSQTSAMLFTALLVGLPYVSSQTSRMLADALLSFFATGAMVCLYLWFQSEHEDDLRLAGFFAAVILFSKKEGTGLFAVFFLVAVIGLILQKKKKLAPRAIAWILGVPILLTAAWQVFSKLHIVKIPEAKDLHGYMLGPSHFFKCSDRIPEICKGSMSVFGAWEDWLAFWLLFFLLLLLTANRWFKRPLLYLAMAALLPILMYGYIFTIIDQVPVSVLIESTAPRVLLQIVGVCAFLMAECVREAKWLPWIRSESKA